MLRWTMMFFVISIVEWMLGFAHPATGSEAVAKIFLCLAIILFVIFHHTQDRRGVVRKDLKSVRTPSHAQPHSVIS